MWVRKIQERFANEKKKFAKAEKKRMQEQGIEVPEGKPGRKRKHANVSVVPAFPEGETEETLESQRKQLVQI